MNNQKTCLITISLILILNMVLFINPIDDPPNDVNIKEVEENDNSKKIRISAPHPPIHIKNNWSAALGAGICAGSGSYSDPYIIEDFIIDGGNITIGILIENSNSSYFRIENCTIFNAGPSWDEPGIKLLNTSLGTIELNNVSHNQGFGILLDQSCSNNTIIKNTVDNNYEAGIQLMDSTHDNLIALNNLSNNNGDAGIHADSHCDNNTVIYNRIIDHKYGGITLQEFCDNNTVKGNIIYNCSDGIKIEGDLIKIIENTITAKKIGIEIDGSNFTVSNNGLFNCGIDFQQPSLQSMISHELVNNTVNGKPHYFYKNQINLGTNNFTNAGEIILVNCNNSYITNMFIADSSNGISLYYGYYNNITFNKLIDCSNKGINLVNCYNNTIQDNSLVDNTVGIFTEFAKNNILKGNLIYNSSYIGVLLYFSNYSLIYNNSFIKNAIQASEVNGFNNNWNNTVIGNFWDNYTGGDLDKNGIGDNPHIFPGNIDYLPLWDSLPPQITINIPTNYTIIGTSAPSFNLLIVDVKPATMWYPIDIDRMWYSLNSGLINYTITSNGTINQLAWNSFGNVSVTIRFYANDSLGNWAFKDIIVLKDIIDPVINIIKPASGDIFEDLPPLFEISINEPNKDSMWYTLNGGSNYYFTGTLGTISQSAWDSVDNGYVTITFYVRDEGGNIGSNYTIVVKDAPEGDDDDDGDTTEEFTISYGNYYMLFTLISIVSMLIIKKLKKTTS